MIPKPENLTTLDIPPHPTSEQLLGIKTSAHIDREKLDEALNVVNSAEMTLPAKVQFIQTLPNPIGRVYALHVLFKSGGKIVRSDTYPSLLLSISSLSEQQRKLPTARNAKKDVAEWLTSLPRMGGPRLA